MRINIKDIVDDTKLSVEDHQRLTIEDCQEVVEKLQGIMEDVKKNQFESFEKFWFDNAAEGVSSQIYSLQEKIIVKYMSREDRLSQ